MPKECFLVTAYCDTDLKKKVLQRISCWGADTKLSNTGRHFEIVQYYFGQKC